MIIYSSILRISMKSTTEIGTNLTQGNYFNNTLQEIEESIEKMYNGEKIKW